MKCSYLVFIAALLACFLTACHKTAQVAGPPPNVAGQWQWSNELLGTWQLDLKEDGTFQRVITNRLDQKPIANSGRWVVSANPPRGGLVRQSDVDDEMLRAAGVDASDKSMRWSAPATLAFFYSVPKGTQLISGAQWNGVTHGQPDNPAAPEEQEIEEFYSVYTHTDTITRKTFLDFDGKVFKTRPTAMVADAPLPPSTPAPGEGDYIAVTPFPGIQLELPAAWEAVDADAPRALPISATTFAHPSPGMKPAGVWRFFSPGNGDKAYIVVAVQPPTFTAKQLADASEINLERFAAGFVKGATHALDGRDFLLSPDVKAERITIGRRTAALCTTAMTDPEGNRRAIRAYAIPSETANIVLVYCWDTEPGKPWKPIMERAWTSLQVADQ